MPRLSGVEARDRLACCRVIRLATADAWGRPHLVPVVFALDGDTLVMAVDHKPKRSLRLKRLANIAVNPEVCLLADGYDEEWDRLWWARADGRAVELPPASWSAGSARDVALLVDKYRPHYEGRPPAGPVIEVGISRWSGWCAS
ncbi:TIGR03668 family PPOX class F420-dependent oxidoreductase [Streptomyces sp. NPDC006923]|uniref:TIGR03668 family PPOX class F420-dependent oxidoreductase n=1 Tax=Streptomyces sp. NPDC006923 TaxID=3155355 RepID=UPI00340D037A